MNGNESSLDVNEVFEFIKSHFNGHVAQNFKNEGIDGKNMSLLARSPDSLALLNRLGIARVKDILRFQDLMGVIRHDVITHSLATHIKTNRLNMGPTTSVMRPSSVTSTSSRNHMIATPSHNSSDSPLSPPSSLHLQLNPQHPPPPQHAQHQPMPLPVPHFQRSTSNNIPYIHYDGMTDRTMANLQQKIIRNEVRKRWTDDDLPTFRKMDTSNNEELDAFVDKLLQIELLTGIGRELIRKKVINILRERRKYVKQKFNEMEEIGESENQLENAPSFLYLEREGEMTFHQEASGHHQEASGHHHKVEMHSESDHEYDGDNSNNSDGPLKKRFKNFPSDNKT